MIKMRVSVGRDLWYAYAYVRCFINKSVLFWF